MVAVSAAAANLFLLRYRHSFCSGRESNNFMGSSNVAIHIPDCFSSTRAKRSFPIRALDPRRQQEEEQEGNSQNDLEYLGKLLAGSVVGGAIIKYEHSFSEITRPNIILALVMIFTPVIIATLLLIKQSRADGQSYVSLVLKILPSFLCIKERNHLFKILQD